MKDAMDIAYDMIGRITQDVADHQKLYFKVEEASNAAWRIWPKVGRVPPKGWSPRVFTEWRDEDIQLQRQLDIAYAAHQVICQAVKDYVHQQQAKHAQATTLGKGKFGHPGKPATKPAKPSKMELREASILAKQPVMAKIQTAKPAAVQLSLLWNPKTKSYQRNFQVKKHAKSHVSNQSQATTLGQGQFGHSGKPAPKSVKPSRMELREAYILANRAIHAHRANFFKLKPQEKRVKLVATAKTLATLKSAKVKAYNRLMKASSTKLIQEKKLLFNWKTPAGGLHTLIKTSVMEYIFKTASQSCPPHKGSQALQLPFQLLWPPDPAASQPPSSLKIQHQNQPQNVDNSQSQRKVALPPNVARDQPLDRRKSQPLIQPLNQPPKQPLMLKRQPPAANGIQSQPLQLPAQLLWPPDPVHQPKDQPPVAQAPDLPPDPDPGPAPNTSQTKMGLRY